jgi:hypothetical protein
LSSKQWRQKKGSFRRRVSSLRKKVFKSLQNIRLGRRSDPNAPGTNKRAAALVPPDPSPLVAPVLLGRPEAMAISESGAVRPLVANTYSETPRQASSEEEEDDDDYDDDDDDDDIEEDVSIHSHDVVYASLRVLPQTTVEQKDNHQNTRHHGGSSDEDDDDEYIDSADDDCGPTEEVVRSPRIPVPAPRPSRLMRHEVEPSFAWLPRY